MKIRQKQNLQEQRVPICVAESYSASVKLSKVVMQPNFRLLLETAQTGTAI
jgi:hypothetical protein